MEIVKSNHRDDFGFSNSKSTYKPSPDMRVTVFPTNNTRLEAGNVFVKNPYFFRVFTNLQMCRGIMGLISVLMFKSIRFVSTHRIERGSGPDELQDDFMSTFL